VLYRAAGPGWRRRAEPIAQIAAQSAALLFTGRHQALTRTLQIGGQAHGMNGHASLAREVGEQPAAGGGEGLAGARGARSNWPTA